MAFIPHVSHYIEEHMLLTGRQAHQTYDFWLRQDFAWLDCCDAVYKMAPSHGADLEEKRAIAQGKPVFYTMEDTLAFLKANEKVEVAA